MPEKKALSCGVGYIDGEESVTIAVAPAMTVAAEVHVVVAIVTGEQHLS